jgi:gamma-glutamyltranspeptidase/glutathione hydrolase
VTQNGRVKLVTGSPGSRGIPSTLLCLLINLVDFNMPPMQAIAAPRLAHQWFPDEITFEETENYPTQVQGLQALGHTVTRKEPRPQGDAQTIWVPDPNTTIGIADWRRTRYAGASGY